MIAKQFTVVSAMFMLLLAAGGDVALSQNAKPKEAKPVPPPEACVSAPHTRLCSTIPHDITETFGFGYSSLNGANQRAFDNFSWQSFIALNWPCDASGKPLSSQIGSNPAAPRVWEKYKTPGEVFGNAGRTSLLEGKSDSEGRRVFQMTTKSSRPGAEAITTGAFHQATGRPLIDRNLNFVVYDIVMNPTEEKYIMQNGLNTAAGQAAFRAAGKQVSFPLGYYDENTNRTGGEVGAIEVKTAWRILVPGVDDFNRYYNVKGVILIGANESESGKPLVINATLGLVGFHAIQRTKGPAGFPQNWMWSTFEHVDNVPLAADAREPTNISLPLPKNCTAPKSVDRKYSFFNIDSSQEPNQPPPSDAKWASTMPYAKSYAVDGKYGTQVVRCWKILPETQQLNEYFQKLLAGTVWANYELVGTQWKGGVEDPTTENGNIPRYLSNSTLETYIQFKSYGSCIDCHDYAKTTAGQHANFSFLLGDAK